MMQMPTHTGIRSMRSSVKETVNMNELMKGKEKRKEWGNINIKYNPFA